MGKKELQQGSETGEVRPESSKIVSGQFFDITVHRRGRRLVVIDMQRGKAISVPPCALPVCESHKEAI